jgi:hypothetical protein
MIHELIGCCSIEFTTGTFIPGNAYPSTQLRQILPSDWLFSGFHQLNLTVSVARVPSWSNGGLTLCSVSANTFGIRGACPSLVDFIYFPSGTVISRRRDDDCVAADTALGTFAVDVPFSLSVTVFDLGNSIVTSIGKRKRALGTHPRHNSLFSLYFQVGGTCRHRPSDRADFCALVISSLSTSHCARGTVCYQTGVRAALAPADSDATGFTGLSGLVSVTGTGFSGLASISGSSTGSADLTGSATASATASATVSATVSATASATFSPSPAADRIAVATRLEMGISSTSTNS